MVVLPKEDGRQGGKTEAPVSQVLPQMESHRCHLRRGGWVRTEEVPEARKEVEGRQKGKQFNCGLF